MNDSISRQAAIDALADMHCKSDEDGYVWIIRSDAWARIDALPSVTPEQRWIPCSERMPQTNVSILYCTTTGTVGEGRYEGYNGFHEVWKMYAICGTHWDDEVIAWMPLPEPYRGGGAE